MIIIYRRIYKFTFQIIVLPQAIAIAEFHPYTATGKLNAVMIPAKFIDNVKNTM